MFNSLKTKMILLISFVILILISGSLFIVYKESREILEETIKNTFQKEAQENAEIVTNWLMATADELNALPV